MRLHLDVHRPGGQPRPVVVTVDDTAPVGVLAQALAQACGASSHAAGVLTVATHVADGLQPIPAETPVAEAGIQSGATVSVIPPSAGTAARQQGAAAVVLAVVEGPTARREFPLPAGPSIVGRERGCDIRLDDPSVSKRHARIIAGETLEVVDLNSANGIAVDGVVAARSPLKVGNRFALGDTVLEVVRFDPAVQGANSSTVPVIRSPRVDPVFGESEQQAPEPPQPAKPQRMPWIALVAPLFMGAGLYFVTRNVASIAFVALSPIMMLGSAVEARWSAKREFKKASQDFSQLLEAFADRMSVLASQEQSVRLAEHPGAQESLQAIRQRSPLAWFRRADRPGFLQLRLGCGSRPSRTTIAVPQANRTAPHLWQNLLEVQERFRYVDEVPVVADLRECGAIGIAGPVEARHAAARGVLLQLLGLHSAADVGLAAVAPAQRSEAWDWVTWLPHASTAGALLGCEPTAAASGAGATLATALEALIEARAAQRTAATDVSPTPAIVVLIDPDAPVDRARLVEIAERGPSNGVYTIWLAANVAGLPAVCRSFLSVTAAGHAETGDVLAAEKVTPVSVEMIPQQHAEAAARLLAPWIDAGVPGSADASLPVAVSFLELVGEDLATPVGVLERWQETGAAMSGKRRAGTLRALIGRAGAEAYTLDLRSQGPHALVGGTTGAGKSELLQTWIMGMATMHSPERVNFLLVDYKGGSAFAECVNLPHTVGLVTDLTPHLVARALTSLHAELRYREQVLHRAKAKDLEELERKAPAAAMPSLVIVVDEFAALASEVPEFVDGMVNIAQRGRSLGLHLILATQRPAGVIRDNLRANTNLRLALRLADADDSNDVIGTDLASTFPQDVPGRAVTRMGPGRLTPFQTAYVGGWTRRDDTPKVSVEEVRFGARRTLLAEAEEDAVPAETLGPTDIQRLVAATQQAAADAGLRKPRRPWLPDLAATYRLLDLPKRRTDEELVIGARDEPEHQRQATAAFYPDTDGNMAVFGTGGSGKSAVLRTLAAAAGLTARGGACHVYALDFGARGLSMLEALPHVGSVIPGEDHERVTRLLRRLRETIDERARRYARVNAGTITEYRAISGENAEPRIIVLLDGIGAFRQAYEVGPMAKWFDVLLSIAADGRQVGVHLVISSDRTGSVPTSLSSVIQRQLVLRLASDTDQAMLGIAADAFSAKTPPGRGFLDGYEVQVAVLGGDPNVAEQARQTASLGDVLRRGGVADAPPIESLPERIALSSLPAAVAGLPALGLADETLGPIGFPSAGVMVVTGPPGSGRTTAVATLVASYRRLHPERQVALLAGKRSSLVSLGGWSSLGLGDEEVGDLATGLVRSLQSDSGKPALIVLEGIADFVNGGAENALQDLVKVCRDYGHLMVVEGEVSGMGGSWGLMSAIKSGRQGLIVQPDQLDGDSVFRTPFPRVSRAEFPPGRGFLVAGGKARRVQVAMPE